MKTLPPTPMKTLPLTEVLVEVDVVPGLGDTACPQHTKLGRGHHPQSHSAAKPWRRHWNGAVASLPLVLC